MLSFAYVYFFGFKLFNALRWIQVKKSGIGLSLCARGLSFLSLERRDLAPERGNQLFDFGGKTHPTLDSYSQPAVSKNPPIKRLFHATCDIPDSPHLGSYIFYLNRL